MQHLPEVRRARGAPRGEGRLRPSTTSRIEDGSQLGALLGERTTVKSHHHQGFGTVGRGLRRGCVRRRRHDRGGRGSGQALRGRRALAPRGGHGRAAVRDARRGGARATARNTAHDRRRQPRDRGDDRRGRAAERRGDRRRRRAREGGVPGLARGRAGRSGRGCCAGSRRSSRSTTRSCRGSSRATSASRSRGARGEVGMVAQVFHFYAGAVDKHHGETIPVAGGVDMTFREPLGVVGLIVPWNFPLNIASWKLGPALACGNTVVLKPAELTPLSALRLAELALEAGHPGGRRQRRRRQGLGRRAAADRASRRGEDRLHRLDRGRPAGDARRGRHDQARHARARRQVGERRLRRRRPGEGGRGGAVRGVRQRRPGLLRALAHPRRALAYDRFAELLVEATREREGRRPRGRRRPRWGR